MRKLETIQKEEVLNEVYAADERGIGNGNHVYIIKSGNKLMESIKFQNGARNQKGSVSGVTNEDLLEIVRDRLLGFQSGEFANEYNEKALHYIELALESLNDRVKDRILYEVRVFFEASKPDAVVDSEDKGGAGLSLHIFWGDIFFIYIFLLCDC